MDENTEEFEAKNSISADLIRGHINTIILRSLYDRDKYGYEIINEINEKSHGQYTLKQPTLYSALKRLENQGYIQAYWKSDEISAGGRRKYFRLTDSGREITEHNQAEWEYSRTVIDNLISDRNFDFNQPAPTPVDFKILKQATSRVPVVHGEGEEEKEDDSHSAENRNGVPMLEARTYTVTRDENTVYIDNPEKTISEKKADEKSEEKSEEVVSSSQTEKQLSYSDSVFHSGSTYVTETENTAEGKTEDVKAENGENITDSESDSAKAANSESELAQTAVQTEKAEQNDSQSYMREEKLQEERAAAAESQHVESYNERIAADAGNAQTTVYEQTESYRSTESYSRPAESTERYQSNEYAANERGYEQGASYTRNSYTSQLGRSAEEEARRRVHENYLKLISEDTEKKQSDETPYADSIDTSKLIYNSRPEQERDYKNLIDKLFDNTLKNTQPAPMPARTEPQVQQPQYQPQYIQEQPAETQPQPVQAEPIPSPQPRYNYLDANSKAASDGLKISTSDEAFAAGSARQATYNKGATLFKCSLIIGVIILLEFTLTMLFRQELAVSVAYPIVILTLGMATVLVCGILFGAHYGSHIRKPTSLRYITTSCIITVLVICIILLFAVILNVNWSLTTDVLAKVVIPCIIALNIPIFTLSFYLFIK